MPGSAISEAYAQYRSTGAVGGLAASPAATPSDQTISETLALQSLIRAHQVIGHQAATLDPLGSIRPFPAELDPAHYGFSEKDMDREFFVGLKDSAGFLSANQPRAKLRQGEGRGAGGGVGVFVPL